MKLRWKSLFRPRRLSLLTLATMVAVLGWAILHRYYDRLGLIDATSRAEATADAVPLGFPPCNDLSFECVQGKIRQKYRGPLDVPSHEWEAPSKGYRQDLPKLDYAADDLPEPSPEHLAQCRANESPVRTLPYPYFRALHLSTDCCPTRPTDTFYTHWTMSREYGLDMPSAFYPYVSGPLANHGANVAIFAGEGKHPVLFPMQLEGKTIDAWPLYLTYYHRGWMTHIHSWCQDAGNPISIVEPAKVALAQDGATSTDLTVRRILPNAWQGLELTIQINQQVDSFEIELHDYDGVPHWIVYGTPWEPPRLAD